MTKNHHKVFEDYLGTVDGRYTSQKRAIVDEIFKIKTHFEVDEFIERVRVDTVPLSRATVYRTIKQLLDAGMLQKIATRDGKIYYERSIPDKHHDHIICNSCGKIFEIKDDVVSQYVNDFCEHIGFVPEYRSLHIYGQCQKCSKKTKV